VNRLKVIQGFQELGLTLERIGELLSTRDADYSREQRLARVRQALEAQENLLSEQVKRIEARRTRLQEARSKLDQCGPCEHAPSAENNFCEPCMLTGRALPEQLSALF
jgi:DNA-binding transcriptional MerR regulator